MKKILYFLLALVVAFGIWTYVVTVVSPESEGTFYDIPVILNNESVLLDKGFIVVSDDTPKMTLQLRGNRSDLNNLKNSDIAIVADLSKINAPGEQTLSCSISFTGNGSGNAFEVINRDPSQITLQIAEWSSKEIPVEVNYTGALGMDYIAYQDEAILDREVITITGPKDAVDQIAKAAVNVSLTGRVNTFSESYRYTLCDAAGTPVDASSIKTNVAEVNLTLKIQRVKEIQLVVDVLYGGGATAKNTVLLQDYLSIKVSGSDKLLDSLGDSLKIGSINLAEEPADTVKSFQVTLPEGIENLSGVKDVMVDIHFEGLAVKTLSVSKIVVTGTPAGMSADIATKLLEVMVRGPEEWIARIEASNITILIDLKDALAGDNLCKAQILVDKSFPGVDALGSYNVLVSLSASVGGTE